MNIARDLGAAAWLMAQTPLKTQPWKPTTAAVVQVGNPKATVSASGLDLKTSRIIWEAEGTEPHIGPTLPLKATPAWIEAEIIPPDGRRLFGIK